VLLSKYITEVMTVNQEINNRNSELFIGDFNRIVDYLVLLI